MMKRILDTEAYADGVVIAGDPVDEPKVPTLPTPSLWSFEQQRDPAKLTLYTMSSDVLASVRKMPCVTGVIAHWESPGTHTVDLNPLYIVEGKRRQTVAWMQWELGRQFPAPDPVATTDSGEALRLSDYSDNF